MGSRIMHYCISASLNQQLHIQDDQFLLGGLAPDAHKSMSEPKDRSHFMKKDQAGVVYIDHRSFYNKYLANDNRDPFTVGYYFHLLSDEIWLGDVYFKKIKWLPPEIKMEAKKQYYRDFRRLNGKLIDYYGLELVPLKEQAIEVEEIERSYLPELIKELQMDFQLADSCKEEALEILGMEEVIHSIEKSVERCLVLFR